MPRIKLSEFRAKTIVNNALGTSYSGIPFDTEHDHIAKFDEFVRTDKRYVVKVDQGIKKRFKQGLIKLDVVGINAVVDAIAQIRKKGFSYFLIEEMIPHESTSEKYIALELTDRGILCYYSQKGGVDIESSENEVKNLLLSDSEDIKTVSSELDIDPSFLEKLLATFEINYFAFLEINPLVITFKTPYMLDIASEVDSAAEFFVDTWGTKDFRNSRSGSLSEEELAVHKLSDKSSSSLALTVLNPDGAIFMLLSGGGVSVALADEVANLGFGDKLANYGEYSGNPTEEETFLYTKNLLSLLLKSKAPKKVLIIGGGVANFTDVRLTFKGVIRALSEVSDKLREQNVKVFVRRGGPHQKEGLEDMRKFLEEKNILGSVNGPEMVVSEIVSQALKSL